MVYDSGLDLTHLRDCYQLNSGPFPLPISTTSTVPSSVFLRLRKSKDITHAHLQIADSFYAAVGGDAGAPCGENYSKQLE